jgi:tRNA (adenine37-N6)-methyltransferase
VAIPEPIAAKLGRAALQLVRSLLRLQLQPAYQDPESRSYGTTVAGWSVRWRATAGGHVEVTEVMVAS